MEYQEEKRKCQNCKKSFIIEPDDFSFYVVRKGIFNAISCGFPLELLFWLLTTMENLIFNFYKLTWFLAVTVKFNICYISSPHSFQKQGTEID